MFEESANNGCEYAGTVLFQVIEHFVCMPIKNVRVFHNQKPRINGMVRDNLRGRSLAFTEGDANLL